MAAHTNVSCHIFLLPCPAPPQSVRLPRPRVRAPARRDARARRPQHRVTRHLTRPSLLAFRRAGFLYTPQQLAGSLKYSSGVLLGNWREDDEIDKMRMMDHIEAKRTSSLTLTKKQERLAPQIAKVPLTPAPADGMMRFGDVVLMQSLCNESTLAVSLGQKLSAADSERTDTMYSTFGCNDKDSMARNAIQLVPYDSAAAGDNDLIHYGQKVCLKFCALEEQGIRGYLASQRSGRSQLSTQLINKQEVYMVDIDTPAPSYECVWAIYPESMDDRVISQGTPVVAGAAFTIRHCFTDKALAGVFVRLPSDFGAEFGVCAHTYVETGKVNKLMRETMGRPTMPGLISQSETDENKWTVLYA